MEVAIAVRRSPRAPAKPHAHRGLERLSLWIGRVSLALRSVYYAPFSGACCLPGAGARCIPGCSLATRDAGSGGGLPIRDTRDLSLHFRGAAPHLSSAPVPYGSGTFAFGPQRLFYLAPAPSHLPPSLQTMSMTSPEKMTGSLGTYKCLAWEPGA